MKCQLCQACEAHVHLKQVTDGDVKELFVCEKCASDRGFEVPSPSSVTDFLFGLGLQKKAEPASGRAAAKGKVCAGCGLSESDFKKNSRLGCARCYETFAEDLKPYIESMHGGTRHVGKMPAGEKVTAELAVLQRKLKDAIAVQNFEEAARLRDAIQELGRQRAESRLCAEARVA